MKATSVSLSNQSARRPQYLAVLEHEVTLGNDRILDDVVIGEDEVVGPALEFDDDAGAGLLGPGTRPALSGLAGRLDRYHGGQHAVGNGLEPSLNSASESSEGLA